MTNLNEGKELISPETLSSQMKTIYTSMYLTWESARVGKITAEDEENTLNTKRNEAAQMAAEAIDALGVDTVLKITKKELQSFINHEFQKINMLTEILRRYAEISQAKNPTNTEESPLPAVDETKRQALEVLDK